MKKKGRRKKGLNERNKERGKKGKKKKGRKRYSPRLEPGFSHLVNLSLNHCWTMLLVGFFVDIIPLEDSR